ncbi:MAG: hypothetical protein ACE5KO_02965 [Candidatus Bathyarchaeia archaeon]
MDTGFHDTAEDALSERDASVLQAIEREDLTGFSFDGLKRKLGAHPETLSRVLDRLEAEGIVQKTLSGYKVTSRGREILKLRPLSKTVSRVRRVLLRTVLPRDIAIHQIISELMGRWFGNLRWIGYSENEKGITLKWITESNGIQVNATFSQEELRIEGKLQEWNDYGEAVKAAHQLMARISKLYSGIEKRIVFFRACEHYPVPA